MKKLSRIIALSILISLLLTLTGCKNTSATKAVDEYLKDIQENPFAITMWYK
jgi:hypothetical protein